MHKDKPRSNTAMHCLALLPHSHTLPTALNFRATWRPTQATRAPCAEQGTQLAQALSPLNPSDPQWDQGPASDVMMDTQLSPPLTLPDTLPCDLLLALLSFFFFFFFFGSLSRLIQLASKLPFFLFILKYLLRSCFFLFLFNLPRALVFMVTRMVGGCRTVCNYAIQHQAVHPLDKWKPRTVHHISPPHHSPPDHSPPDHSPPVISPPHNSPPVISPPHNSPPGSLPLDSWRPRTIHHWTFHHHTIHHQTFHHHTIHLQAVYHHTIHTR